MAANGANSRSEVWEFRRGPVTRPPPTPPAPETPSLYRSDRHPNERKASLWGTPFTECSVALRLGLSVMGERVSFGATVHQVSITISLSTAPALSDSCESTKSKLLLLLLRGLLLGGLLLRSFLLGFLCHGNFPFLRQSELALIRQRCSIQVNRFRQLT